MFDAELQVNSDNLTYILQHSRDFQRFVLYGSDVDCEVPTLYLLFTTYINSSKLTWLVLTDLPISTVCSLRNTPNIEILNLSHCKNLNDSDFTVIESYSRLQRFKLSISRCTAILSVCYETLIAFHLSVEDSDVGIHIFKNVRI